MEYSEFLRQIKTSCSFLEKEGYQLKEKGRVVWYEKHTPGNGVGISFNWTQYDILHVHALKASKRFNEVEKEVIKVTKDNLNDSFTVHVGPEVAHIPQELNFETTGKNLHFKMRSSADTVLFAEFMKNFICQKAVPIFNEYDSVDKIDQKLSTMRREEISSLLVGGGNSLFFRELVIKYLAKNSSFETYYEDVIKALESHKGNRAIDEEVKNFKWLKQQLSGN